MEEIDDLVTDWLTVPDAAEALGIDAGRVRRLIQDRNLAAVRRGTPRVLSIPAAFVSDGQPLQDLRGTLTVLADAGFSDAESIAWLFTPDETLPGTPVEALLAGRKTEIRRRAQALAV